MGKMNHNTNETFEVLFQFKVPQSSKFHRYPKLSGLEC
jgi:hypothetical protein